MWLQDTAEIKSPKSGMQYMQCMQCQCTQKYAVVRMWYAAESDMQYFDERQSEYFDMQPEMDHQSEAGILYSAERQSLECGMHAAYCR